MRIVKYQPKAAEVAPGATVLWTNPEDRSQLRTSFLALVLGAGVVGYAVAKNRPKTRNPSTRKKRKKR